MKLVAQVFAGVLLAKLVRPVVVMGLAEIYDRRCAKELNQQHESRFTLGSYMGLL